MDTEYIRERITALRLRKGVSEYQMSYDLGRSRSYIYNISSGKSTPPMDAFLQICDYFEVSPSVFFDDSVDDPVLLHTAEKALRRLSGDDLALIVDMMRRLLNNTL